MSDQFYLHTLSFPEMIWIDFWREFFRQEALIVDDNGLDIANRFHFDQAKDPANRSFDILFEYDLDKANPNILPCVVIEDMGTARLNIGLNHLHTWGVTPETFKERSDLLRTTYVFHCCSRNRGESRLLASIVSNACSVFYDQLKRAGLHKIEPWSIGKTVPLKLDSDEVYVDTPVQVTFEFQQTWKTVEGGSGEFRRYCFLLAPETLVTYVRTSLEITDPSQASYVLTSMDVDDQNVTSYVNTSLDAQDPLDTQNYILSSMNVQDQPTAENYVRTSMRVS